MITGCIARRHVIARFDVSARLSQGTWHRGDIAGKLGTGDLHSSVGGNCDTLPFTLLPDDNALKILSDLQTILAGEGYASPETETI
ncbi:MAG: hypothetical protein GDA56_08285 [Hormoscilla sp. GM7CHS1pb]|nr:hypothetical protein [Hormoscilla sp. GM7CHS1pb]